MIDVVGRALAFDMSEDNDDDRPLLSTEADDDPLLDVTADNSVLGRRRAGDKDNFPPDRYVVLVAIYLRIFISKWMI